MLGRSSFSFFVIALLLVNITVLSSCEILSPPDKEEDELTDQIVFSSDRNNDGIYLMDPDGSNQRLVTEPGNPAETDYYRYSEPSVSPKGNKIVFEALAENSETGNQYANIYTVNVDGTSKTKIAGNNDDSYYLPSWGPEENKIALTIYREDEGQGDIYTMDAQGNNRQRLTTNGGAEPDWSPDGSELAYNSFSSGNVEIYIIEEDGTGRRQITEHDSTDYMASWSPDGERLAFVSDRDGDPEIYTINVQGTELRQITDNEVNDANPTFNEDGSAIYYHSYNGSNYYDIYKKNISSGQRTNITVTEDGNFDPEWAGVGISDE